MAKLALTLTLFIALFLLTGAKHPLDLHTDDSVSVHDPSITLPEPDSKRTILLPSEKPESLPATVVELEHNEDVETENETTAEIVDEEEEEKPEWRFAWRDLRPVLPRDADHKMMFVLRHPHHHRCRQPRTTPRSRPRPHHQMLFRQEKEVGETERSYGNDMLAADPAMEKGFVETEGSLENDMLVADPEMEMRFDEEALEQDLTEIRVGGGGGDGGRRHAPWRWVGLHFGGRPRFPDHEHGPHHHHHHHHHHHERDEDEEHRHEGDGPGKRPFGLGRREEQNGGGLVKRFRKFLHKIEF